MICHFVTGNLKPTDKIVCTGIPGFTLLMWGLIKNAESKNLVNQGYLVR